MIMGKSPQNLWRETAGLVLAVWILLTAIKLFCFDSHRMTGHEQDIITMEAFLVLSGGTVTGLAVLVVFPLKFYIYAAIFCFWGLVHIIEGGNVCGFLMYLLGLSFAYKNGFFKSVPQIKSVAAVLIGIGAIGMQYRYGTEVILGTVVHCCVFFLIIRIGVFLLLPKLQELQTRTGDSEHKMGPAEPGSLAPAAAADVPPRLSGQERMILACIQRGDKYGHIASAMNMSVTTLKRTVKELFQSLGVFDRTEFLIKYRTAVFSEGAA